MEEGNEKFQQQNWDQSSSSNLLKIFFLNHFLWENVHGDRIN
jgi:hypothetical protein